MNVFFKCLSQKPEVEVIDRSRVPKSHVQHSLKTEHLSVSYTYTIHCALKGWVNF